jgi:hypothetical protein
MQTRFKRILAGGVAAAALTVAIGGAAFAQTPTPSGTPGPIQQRAEEFLSALAGKLGKTPAEVKTAVVSVQKDRVAADLAAGRITPEQATRLNQRIDQAGGLGALHPGPAAKGDRGRGAGGPAKGDRGPAKGARGPAKGAQGPAVGADLATFLGVQPAELAQALRSGKSLAAFALEKGKSRDALKEYLTTQQRTRLAAAVTAGRATQAQADAQLARFTAQIDQLIDRAAVAGRGGPGKRAPRGGAPAASPTATPIRA